MPSHFDGFSCIENGWDTSAISGTCITVKFLDDDYPHDHYTFKKLLYSKLIIFNNQASSSRESAS